MHPDVTRAADGGRDSRPGRICEFKDLEAVELTLQALTGAAPHALVTQLPRLPGTKEPRFAHLLSGAVSVEEAQEITPRLEAATLEVRAENERIAALEGRVEALQQEMTDLKKALLDFKQQFE